MIVVVHVFNIHAYIHDYTYADEPAEESASARRRRERG